MTDVTVLPLADHQAIQFMLEVSIAKAYGVEMAQRVLDRAIQIHGTVVLSNEARLEGRAESEVSERP